VTADSFKNLLVFLMLMAGEDAPAYLLDKHPEYVLEKWYRYVNAPLPTGDGWRWGLHPILRTVFDKYVEKWKVDALWPQKEVAQ
jgi:hypothetical protein